MEPGKFGPYLRGLRIRRGLTQERVAEALHVSGAAVSKWETGKCLPDLAKLEALAEILDISVPELMGCGAADREAPSIRQTAAEASQKAGEPSRRRIRGAAALLLFTALVVFFQYFPLYRAALVWQPSWFETGEISLLAYTGSREDRRTAQPVMALAEQAFSTLGLTRTEAAARYGELSRYCFPRDLYPEVVREEHSLDLWSAHFDGGCGHLWVYYSQHGYDEADALRTGSSRVPALWYLEQTPDGAWEVISIKEHP